MSYAVVVPSKNIRNLTACVMAIRNAGEDCPIIVIDDGMDWPWDEMPTEWGNVTAHMGTNPFIFARAVNEGIVIADKSDVLICNDDALLETHGGFEELSDICRGFEYGALCPGFTHGSVGTLNLVNRGRIAPVEEKVMLVFACVYIPRSTIDRVGLLDERFGINAGGPGARGYGLEDDDYSLRIRQAGLKLGVYDGVLVDHLPESTGLKSTFRHDPAHPHDVRAHEDLFAQKHGHWPEGHGFAPGKSRMPK